MGTYCSATVPNNQAVMDYLKNKIFEIDHAKKYGEEPFNWRFDGFWKKRITASKNLKDKVNLSDMMNFISSFPEMKKNKNQKILKDYKKWPYISMGVVKSTYLVDCDFFDRKENSNNINNKGYNKYTNIHKKKLVNSTNKNYNNSNTKTGNNTNADGENSKLIKAEFLGSGYLISNSVVLTLVKNIYLYDTNRKSKPVNYIKSKAERNLLNSEKDKEKEIKAQEVKFYACFNGNSGIECEVDAVHHLDYDDFSEISNDVALLFLKKPIGEELGFVGIWDKYDFPDLQCVDVSGYLYDDFYENKIFLNEFKMQIKSETKASSNTGMTLKNKSLNIQSNNNKKKCEDGNIIKNNYSTYEGNLVTNSDINNNKSKENKIDIKQVKRYNCYETEGEFEEDEEVQDQGEVETSENSSPIKHKDSGKDHNKASDSNKNSSINSNSNPSIVNNPEPEYFFFPAEQAVNLLPGAAIWANKFNKQFLLGLYIGKHPKNNSHYGKYLCNSSLIANIKEWILDYWYESAKENTKIFIASEELKAFKTEAIHIIANKYNQLTSLHLNDVDLKDDDVLLIVKNIPNLKTLKLRNNNLTTDTAIYISNNQRSIEELDLSYNNIGYVGIKEIAWKLGRIKVLLLEKIGLRDNYLFDISANLIDLAVLDVGKNFITNDGILAICKGNLNLSEFYLGNNDEVSDEAMEHIAHYLQKLETLDLNEINITDAGICSLTKKLYFLKKLNLFKCKISDEAVNTAINSFKFLTNLNISQCNTTEDFKRALVKSKLVKNLIV